MNVKILWIVCFVLIGTSTMAQGKLSIDNVYTVTLRNTGVITEGDEIKGYYLFYQSDKIDKKTNEYTLRILDQNLAVVKDIKFADVKTIQLFEAAYNGQGLMFAFYDSKEKTFSYKVYGFDGKQTQLYTKVLEKRTYNLINYYEQGGEDGENKNLFDIPGKGFISVVPLMEARAFSAPTTSYEVNFYATGQRKQWNYTSPGDVSYSSAQYLGNLGNTIFLEVLKTKSMMKETESWLLALDINTGKKKFEIITQDSKHKFLPFSIVPGENENSVAVMGSYFKPDALVTKAKPLGVAIWTLDEKGKTISTKTNSWEKDFSKFLKTDAKGNIKEIGYLFFHEIIKASNGRYYGIGEGFKKMDEATGMVLGAIAGTSAVAAKVASTDMVLVEFNENFDVTNAVVYDKHENTSMVPNGAFLTPHMLAIMMKYAVGGFDFNYLQSDKDKTNFVVGYSSFKKSKGIEDYSFNTISYYNGQFSTDKINLVTKATRLQVFPAKLGSVMIMEYFKKEKKLELRLEKVN